VPLAPVYFVHSCGEDRGESRGEDRSEDRLLPPPPIYRVGRAPWVPSASGSRPKPEHLDAAWEGGSVHQVVVVRQEVRIEMFGQYHI